MSEIKPPENPKYRASIHFVQEDDDSPVFCGLAFSPNELFDSLDDVPAAYFFAQTGFEVIRQYMDEAEEEGEVLLTDDTPVSH